MIKEKFFEMFNTGDDIIYDYELYKFVKNTLLNNREDIPRLYRYSPADYYNIRGLETQTLFLSKIGTMNDIFEGLSCEVDGKILDMLEDYSDIAYIKSFSEEKNNLLMWAHYAENYSGMCVEYDFSKLNEDILYHLFPVYYSKKRFKKQNLKYTINELYLLKKEQKEYSYFGEKYFLNDIMYLFLVKPECWSYEKEWRMIGTFPQIMIDDSEDMNDEENDNLYKIWQKISVENCIKSVYLGARMKSDVKDHIVEICKEKLSDVKVYFANLSENEYKLDYKQQNI